MNELIFLLFNGPTLKESDKNNKRDYKSEKRPSIKIIEEYKSYSSGNQIWSSLITKHKAIKATTASRVLRNMKNVGLLKEAGRVKGTRSSSPPYIYEWV